MTDEFSPKDPAEIVPLSFDFAALTSAPINPVVTVVRDSGPKGAADLSGMLLGTPQITGTEVLQKVQGGIATTTYRVRAQVDTAAGLRYVLTGLLPVETA